MLSETLPLILGALIVAVRSYDKNREAIMGWFSWGQAKDAETGKPIVRGRAGNAERLTHRGDADTTLWGRPVRVFRDDAGRKVYVDPDENVGVGH